MPLLFNLCVLIGEYIHILMRDEKEGRKQACKYSNAYNIHWAGPSVIAHLAPESELLICTAQSGRKYRVGNTYI